MYKQDVVYIWQNQVGEYAYLNGVECMLTSGINPPDIDSDKYYWWTDTKHVKAPLEEQGPEWTMMAWAGDLREKYPPSGERSILELFKQPELEPA